MARIIIFIIVAVALIAGGVWYNGKVDKKAQEEALVRQKELADAEAAITATLQKMDLVTGTGVEAKNGDTVSVNYVGTLDNGGKFDSSYDRNQLFEFVLGAGQVIKGWDLGVLGMKVGGKRKLIIPPALGYGNRPIGSIPSNSTLHFIVELLGVKSSSK
jgi:FKBP-type peptidyl-prolyl cis-trans isomerase